MLLYGSQAQEFQVKGQLDYEYKEGQPVRWRQRQGMYAGIGTIRGYADSGDPPLGAKWIVDIGQEILDGYYPYSCILVFAIDLEPVSSAWERQLREMPDADK